MEEFQTIVDDLKKTKDNNLDRKKNLEDQRILVAAVDAVQKAVVETTKVTIEAMTKELQSIEVTNQPETIKTPDSLTAGKAIEQAVKDLNKVVTNKNIDLSPIVTQLEALGELVAQLPTSYPTFPEFPSEMAINNVEDITSCIDELSESIKAIEFSPKITVKPTDVKVNVPEVNIDLKELKELKKSIEKIKFPDSSKVLNTLIKSTEDVAMAVRSIEFPVPNFRTKDIVDAVIGRTDALRIEIDTTNSPVIYFGKAEATAEKDEPVWQIAKGDTTSGLSKSFPNGDSSFNFVWEDRATLTYN